MHAYGMDRCAHVHAYGVNKHTYVHAYGVNMRAYVPACGLNIRALGVRLTGEKIIFFNVFYGQYG
jgi:hypothetical protein